MTGTATSPVLALGVLTPVAVLGRLLLSPGCREGSRLGAAVAAALVLTWAVASLLLVLGPS